MYQFRALQDTSMEQLAACFNLAFSDYEQPICFTPESLKYYLTASSVDLSLSFGAFCGGELVAIILNSKGIYKQEQVVFDAGTGVTPGHRGKGVFSELFAYTCQQLRLCNITKYYLEVLQGNNNAVSIYRKKGFSIQREFAVLVASGARGESDPTVVSVPYEEFVPYATGFSVEPSFEHTRENADRNPQLYEVLSAADQAYCIYAKRQGAILQLHYNDPEALKKVLTALISRFPKAMAKNIDRSCTQVLEILGERGFSEVTKQYEMAREI